MARRVAGRPTCPHSLAGPARRAAADLVPGDGEADGPCPAAVRQGSASGVRVAVSRILAVARIPAVMRRATCLLAVAGVLGACVPMTQEQIARETARNVVRPILANRFPGVPLEPLTDCVIDNATLGELNALARASITGLTPDTYGTIIAVATRPATLNCLATDGIAGLTR